MLSPLAAKRLRDVRLSNLRSSPKVLKRYSKALFKAVRRCGLSPSPRDSNI